MRPYCIVLATVLCACAFGQPPDAPVKFEIARVQTSAATGSRPFMSGPYSHPDRYEIRNASMLDLVRTAYSVDPDKVLGGPNWLEFDRFDITARAPAGTAGDAMKLMLQALLADRFGLKVHNDSKPFPAYTLSLGKNPKLKPSDGSGSGNGCSFSARSTPSPSGGPGGPMTLIATCHDAPIASFSNSIRGFIGMAGSGSLPQVVDKTDLKGTYEIELRVVVDSNLNDASAAFIDALDQQLGLKLEMGQLPMPVVVVDSANRTATPNSPDSEKSFPPLPSEFDVVSLKPGTPFPPPTPGRPTMRAPAYQNDRVNLQYQSVRQLINLAWNLLPSDTLEGAPKWLESDRYDVVAKVPQAAAPLGRGAIDIEAYRPMYRALLIDRFQLKVHFEDRPADTYVLTAVKPKLQKADPDKRSKWSEGPGPDGKDPRKTNPALGRLVNFQNVTMAQFAALLPSVAGGYLQKAAVDKTGLDGAWDFTLNFSGAGVVNGMGLRGGDVGPGGAPSAADPSGGLSLFDAVAKQLGLKLELQKRPAPTLVIDHIEQKPKDN